MWRCKGYWGCRKDVNRLGNESGGATVMTGSLGVIRICLVPYYYDVFRFVVNSCPMQPDCRAF